MTNKHNIQAQVEAEQIKLLYRALPASVAANFLAGILIVALQWNAIPETVLITWLFCFESWIVLRGILYWRYARTYKNAEYEFWRKAFVVAVVITGVMWGIAGIIMFPSGDELHQVTLVFALLGLSAGAVSSHSYHRISPSIFVLLTLIPIFLRFLYEGTTFGYVVAAILVLCLAYLLAGARRSSAVITENIRMRFEAVEKENEVEESRKQAEQASRAKDDFLSRMSHELRTPMNAILGFSQILEMETKEGGKKHEFAREITAAGEHLLSLINELLELSTIEAGKIELNIKDERISPVIKECVRLMMPLAKKHAVEIVIDESTDSNVLAEIDTIKFKQALINLLSNATKYSKPESVILINTKTIENEFLRVTVTDSGQGLDDAQQKLLFNQFERINAHKTGVEGTGIGLVITKRIIELMGGSIGFTSAKGQGSSFWLDVKLSLAELVSSVLPGESE